MCTREIEVDLEVEPALIHSNNCWVMQFLVCIINIKLKRKKFLT